MNFMRSFIFLSITLLLAGCAGSNTNYYNQTVQSWRGGNTSNLVSQWGTPDRRLGAPDGQIVYIYNTQSYRNAPLATSPAIGVNVQGGKPVIVSTPTPHSAIDRGPTSLSCTAMFVANKQGKIIDVQAAGNGCYGSKRFSDRLSNSH